MLSGEQRAKMSAMWLAHWRGWQSAGVSMAEYARRQGFDADAAYRWKRVLRRTGQWDVAEVSDAAPQAVTARAPKAVVRFARVALKETAVPESMRLRVVLGNGRRAELEIVGMAQLGAVLGVLERAA